MHTSNNVLTAFTPDDEHHDEGTLFVRTLPRGESSSYNLWESIQNYQLDTGKLPKPEDVFVRIYRPDGEISHYVPLVLMEQLIEYRNFCKKNRIQHTEILNLGYINAAIKTFRQPKEREVKGARVTE